MSKTKSKSKRKSGSSKPKKPAPVSEVPVGEEAIDEMSAGEKFLLSAKPYWAHIALGVLCVILASVLFNVWGNMRAESASIPWQELSVATTEADLTRDPSSWKEMAANNVGVPAGNWALLMAGDDEFNRGVTMLPNDRVGGFKLVKRAEESVQQVLDAPATSKSPDAQQRSVFMMGQIKETLGEFDKAKEMYQTLIESAPDSPFVEYAKRAVERCSNPEIAAFYKRFREFEEVAEVAPGPLVPEAPQLDLDPLNGEAIEDASSSADNDEKMNEKPSGSEGEDSGSKDSSAGSAEKSEAGVKDDSTEEESGDDGKNEKKDDSADSQ